ncbi:hypothetical protein EPUL_001850 [Erysiphe pulchra]|uniref:RecA family profile 1 domain-containing protein n=1 Tax=Erysiphe pulchra TaxID=225359 RepID=A0A2S4PTS8_9PEZI|nr:hypothetical protein EPUL_001850 [Erysiphe pulchra]
MPTISAAQALRDLTSSPARCISTGIHELDMAIQNKNPSDDKFGFGGISRGQVTEIHGPPGVGKTALAVQLAASVLYSGEEVVWIDASHKISGARLAQTLKLFKPLNTASPPSSPSLDSLLSRFTQFSTPTLAHLMAILSILISGHLPQNTGLLVIDSLSALTTIMFSRDLDALSNFRKSGPSKTSGSKFPILQKLISSMQKLAATRNISVVVTLQCSTKINHGLDAILVPAINISTWEQGLGCRLVLFRNWGWNWNCDYGNYISGFRFAKVIKAMGAIMSDDKENVVGLRILESGLISYIQPNLVPQNTTVGISSKSKSNVSIPQKRKLLSSEIEIVSSDNDEENYGWRNEDENELPPPPPQWQGSEDLLVGVRAEDEDEDEDGRDQDLDLGIKVHEESSEDLCKLHVINRKPILKKIIIENSDSEDELA